MTHTNLFKASVHALISIAILTSPCARSAEPTATLNIELASDAKRTTGKFWRISTFEDRTCQSDDRGTQIAKKLLGNSGGLLKPVSIPAGREVTIGFGYIESRFKQTRECSYTLTFTPTASRNYKAFFSVNSDTGQCGVVLQGDDATPVETSAPALACVHGLMPKLQNGQMGGRDVDIQMKILVPITH